MVLDNVPNLQSSWVTMGMKVGQIALRFGCNDFGSLMIEENVVSAAGTTHRTTIEEMRRLIVDAGFKAARRAFDEHERVLKLDPSRKDAGLIVGTYRYVVSTLSLPMRMMAYIAGFGGGKERGIAMIEETAAAGGDNRADALFALVLVYNRERRYDDALRALEELHKAYPRNRLVLLETGATALRAERFEQADATLTRGLSMLAADTRARMAGEEALWRYKRGAARTA